MAGPVTLERDGALAILTLTKPPLNLFDRPLFDALAAAIDDVAHADCSFRSAPTLAISSMSPGPGIHGSLSGSSS